ncbi:MAG: penicillin-binding transpeptidase domain-containing protein, partial [Acidobacteriota bacterium]
EGRQEQPLDMISKPFQIYAAERVPQVFDDGGEGSLRIYTTMDEDLQRGAVTAVERQLARLDPKIESRRLRLGREDGGRLESALVALDARSGEILAMTGGRDEFNRALARRSPASAIKPFVYLKAIERGWHDGPFTAATIIDPRSDRVDNYRPTRHVGASRRARQHLAVSDNGAAVVAAHDAGLAEVRDFIRRLTGSYSEELTGMLAIGGSRGCEVSPLDLASAYTVFPNGGSKVSVTPFAAIYRDGVKVEVARRAQERMIGSEAAYVVTEMMRSVVGSGPDGHLGTARGVKGLAGLTGDYEIAGKTGTGEVSDFWFVGFTPRLVVAVWVGMDDNMPLGLEDGFDAARVAMPVWADFMRAVKAHRPDLLEGRFLMPPGVRALRIDPVRGCVTKRGGIEEYFIAGREPRNCEP